MNIDNSKNDEEYKDAYFVINYKTNNIFNKIIYNIQNYRPLTDLQIKELETFTNDEKYKIIKIYNNMFSTLKDFIN